MALSRVLVLLSTAVLINSAWSELDFKCTEQESKHPHYDNCQKFYFCQNSKLYIDSCPAGQRFDAPSSQCLDKNKAICASRPPTINPDDSAFSCPSENGIFFHESLCQEFYDCRGWTSRRWTCPKGTLFDQHSRTCTNEAEVDCGIRLWPDGALPELGFRCTEEVSRHPYYEQCNKFYMCQNGKVYIDSCPSGTLFDAPSRKCVERTSAVCAQRPTIPPTTTTAVTIEVTSRATSSSTPFACATRNGNYPDEDHCDRYYMCFNFLPYDMTCPSGTLFDQERRDCVEETAADCGRTVLPEESTSRLGFKCGSGTSGHPNFVHCSRFYLCRDGKAYTAACPDGQLFDEPSRECVHNSRATCAASTEAPPTTKNPGFKCDQRNGIFFHEELCEMYYECFNWLPYEHRCPQGMLLDQHSKMCKPETMADCGNRRRPDGASTQEPEITETDRQDTTSTTKKMSTTQSTTTTRRTTTTESDDDSGEFEDLECPEPNGLFPYPKDKHKYISCTGGFPFLMDCPADLVFDPVKRVCVWDG